MTKTEVHVLSAGARSSFSVNGIAFGFWPQPRAVRLALRAARALATTQGVLARVVIHGADGRVRSVLSFGYGEARRMRYRRSAEVCREVSLPAALAIRYARGPDLT